MDGEVAVAGRPLDETVALVTGASSGLGRQLSLALDRAGATVAALARRGDRLGQLAEEGARITQYECDVTDESMVRRTVERVTADLGVIDVLVNNAGTSDQQPARSTPTEDFRRVLEVNLVSQFVLAREVAGRLIAARRPGAIINIASIFGLVASAPIPQSAYVASKGGLVALTRHLAVEWAEHGIRVNAIAPGWFESELTHGMFDDDEGMSWIRRQTPLRRAGAPGELDSLTCLLASRESSFVTGVVVPVDGGWTAR